MAKHADKFSIVRSMYHTAAAVHDTGHQMMQTGRIFQGGIEHPHIGCVLGKLKGPNGDVPPHVLLPRPIGNTGGNMPHGQNAGYLGKSFDPFVLNADPSDPNFRVPDMLPPDYLSALRVDRRRNWRAMVDKSVSMFETSQDARLLDSTFQQAYTLMSSQKARDAFELHRETDAVREKYGMNRFGQSCLLARRLVEAGVRFVTVNMFETVFDEITWDIHGSKPFSPISCYRDLVGPMFDMAYSSLLEDLQPARLLSNTMVVAFGEFGRTPKVNPAGGRDHWPQCWSILMGGGPLKGGTIVGASDEIGAAPKDRPTTPAEVAATIYKGLGIDPSCRIAGRAGPSDPVRRSRRRADSKSCSHDSSRTTSACSLRQPSFAQDAPAGGWNFRNHVMPGADESRAAIRAHVTERLQAKAASNSRSAATIRKSITIRLTRQSVGRRINLWPNPAQ